MAQRTPSSKRRKTPAPRAGFSMRRTLMLGGMTLGAGAALGGLGLPKALEALGVGQSAVPIDPTRLSAVRPDAVTMPVVDPHLTTLLADSAEGALPSIIDPPLDRAPVLLRPSAQPHLAALSDPPVPQLPAVKEQPVAQQTDYDPVAPVRIPATPEPVPQAAPAVQVQQVALRVPEAAPTASTAPPQARSTVPTASRSSVAATVRREPAWRAFAAPARDPGSRPVISVVIDDLGLARNATQRIMALPGPLGLAFMPYASAVATQAAMGRAFGHEILVHMPMQPMGEGHDPGPGALMVGLSGQAVRQRLDQALAAVPEAVGLNNHMGSRFTANRSGMTDVMDHMASKGLLFVDSRTTNKSVAPQLARAKHVPFAERSVFLDHSNAPQDIRDRMAQAERIAKRHGHVLVIGHPRRNTAEALESWLPTLSRRGFALLPPGSVIQRLGA